MKDKEIISLYEREARRELLNIHLSMFEYGNLPDTIDPFFLESFLQSNDTGSFVAWFRTDSDNTSPGFPEGSLIVASANFGKTLNPYGEGTEVIAVTKNGKSYRFDNRYSDDVAIGFNNLIKLPCSDIELDAQTIAAVDLSILYLIHYTRLYPIFKIQDEKEREKVITAFKNMELGKPLTIIDDNLLADLGVESSGITVDKFTSPDLANQIQYISKLREDLKRWHLTKYGQTVNGNSKLAQETVDEVNGTVSASLIIPLSMLAARRMMVEEVNRKFGTNITVDFSGAWRAEVTRYEDLSGEGDIDDTEPEAPEEEVKDNEDTEEKATGSDSGDNDDNEPV